MSHFFLTLPSNSSEKFYPENTMTHFKTKLHNDVSLSGEWEVALYEIIFSYSVYNVGKDEKLTISCDDCRGYSPPQDDDRLKFRYDLEIPIQYGYYPNIHALLTEINRTINARFSTSIPLSTTVSRGDTTVYKTINHDARVRFGQTMIQRKTYISLPANCTVTMSTDMSQILGFRQTTVENKGSITFQHDSDTINDLNSIYSVMYVYCDLLEYVLVGDTAVPLLKIFDAGDESQRFGTVHRRFEKPMYVPVQKKNFDAVEIRIKDAFARDIPFEAGNLVAILHFRKAQETYFLK